MTVVPLRHYILAGGRSRRFGSDKARYRIDGRPMIQRVADAFTPLCFSTTVVAQRPNQYADLGLPTIADLRPDAGPIEGLRTALRHAHRLTHQQPTPTPTSPWILLSSCDLYRPHLSHVQPLAQALCPNTLASVWTDDERFEPFPGLFHQRLLESPDLRTATSFQRLLTQLGPQTATMPRETQTAHPIPWDLDHRPTDLDMTLQP
ncbi:MAG: molybdenum cofactor guanylyltransferase [Planctomycetota bacterium]